MPLTWFVRAKSSRKSSTLSMAAKQGEVWLADLGLAAKTSPVVILSQDDPQAPRALVTYVPLTTQNRGSPLFLERVVCCEYTRYWLYPGNSFAEKTRLPLDREYKQDLAGSTFGIGSVNLAEFQSFEPFRRCAHQN